MAEIFTERSSFYTSQTPFSHLVIDDLLPGDQVKAIADSFWDYNDVKWEKFGRSFYNDHGQKKQMESFTSMPEPIKRFFSSFMSAEFIAKLSQHTSLNIEKANLFGAGMNLYAPGAELKKHADFNFNDEIKMYRCLNLLYYVSDWKEGDGGCLQLYHPEAGSALEVSPKQNRVVIFPTNLDTPHGVSKTSPGFFRKSLGIYYYTRDLPQNVSSEPHRTIWKDND